MIGSRTSVRTNSGAHSSRFFHYDYSRASHAPAHEIMSMDSSSCVQTGTRYPEARLHRHGHLFYGLVSVYIHEPLTYWRV